MISLPFSASEPARSNKPAYAGWEAERQMAFYLDRAFAGDTITQVFHGLRLRLPEEHAATTHAPDGDFFQIDHLVLHKHGIVLIESKSMYGEVQINKQGDWTRITPGRREGIPSPLNQARRQADSLRTLLQVNRATLREKKLFGLVQGAFKHCPIECLVAIADHAVITGPGRTDEVLKASSVDEAVKAIIERHRAGNSLFTQKTKQMEEDGMYSFSETELFNLRAFLVSRHERLSVSPSLSPPRPPTLAAPVGKLPAPALQSTQSTAPVAKAVTPAIAPHVPPVTTGATTAAERLDTLTCKHCASTAVSVVYARDYCVQCGQCQRYTPLSRNCVACDAPARIRKAGEVFSRVCGCGKEVVFWRNGAR